MPSTTRGSILISTANDIGEALVEKLGGVGYSPNEWKDKFNLCGIAPIDSAPALSVLADSAGTGDERGSILIATADAIGAILNKKYNVLRGFKPKEWASACRKMKALEEGSVASASIASFSDGADTVPLTSCVCSIDANLDGKTAVNAVHAGVNLLPMVNYDGGVYNPDVGRVLNLAISETQFTKNGNVYSVTTSATWKTFTVLFPIVEGVTYYEKWTLSIESGQQGSTRAYLDKDFKVLAKYNSNSSDPIITNMIMTPPTGAKYLAITWTNRGTAVQTLNITEPMIELGSSASTYEAYKGETKTADLGRTIYGGQADIVNGTAEPTNYLDTANAETKSNNSVNVTCDGNGKYTATGTATGGSANITFTLKTPCEIKSGMYLHLMNSVANGSVSITLQKQDNTSIAYFALSPLNRIADLSSYTGQTIYSIRFYIVNGASFEMTLTPMLCYNSAVTPYSPYFAPFTFEPVKIDSFPGVNNIWNDCGNTAVDYYQAPTPYARKTATGGIANFSDQRTDLPLTKAIANIAPSIAGKSAVNLYQGKKNLWEFGDKTVDQVAYIILYLDKPLPQGTYTISCELTSTTTYCSFRFRKEDGSAIVSTSFHANVGRVSQTLTLTEPAYRIYIYSSLQTGGETTTWKDVQIEVGSSASAYEQYQDPTTYTAELGETVYGGSVDFVSGEVEKICGKITYNGSENWNVYSSGNGYAIGLPTMESGTWYTSDLSLSYPLPKVPNNDSLGVRIGVNNNGIYVVQANTIEGVTDITSFKAYLSENPLTIIYPLATPTESAIPGRVISPIEGVNNYWNDAGGDTEIQYFENET